MDTQFRRDPERLLREIEQEERRERRGRLKIFLGYASGVGKSAKMLAEGLRRRERGEDVVVGAIQPSLRLEIDRLLLEHEIIPTLKVGDREVIDIERILRRHPQVVVIDGLAYTNPPGSRHPERWQEIEELLKPAFPSSLRSTCITSGNCRTKSANITGKRPAETVPLDFFKRADDIEIIDAPAQARRIAASRDGAAGGGRSRRGRTRQLSAHASHRRDLGNSGTHPRRHYAPIRRPAHSGKRQAQCRPFSWRIVRRHMSASRIYRRKIKRRWKGISQSRANWERRSKYWKVPRSCARSDQFAREIGITQIFIGHSQQNAAGGTDCAAIRWSV